MPLTQMFPTPQEPDFKASIVYDDVASAAKANATLQHSVQRADDSLSGKATEMLHDATRNPEPRSLILVDSSFI